MGFKTFTAGSVLTAADLNDYLMKQAVIVCTSGTRPTAVDGMTIKETDTDRVLTYDSTAGGWIILSEPAQTWSPTFSSGVTVGNGTWSASTHREDGFVHLEAAFTFGSTSAITGDILLALPYTRSLSTRNGAFNVSFYDSSGGVEIVGQAAYTGTATSVWLRALNAASTYGGMSACSSTVPFTWATSDVIFITGRYRASSRTI